MGAVRTVVVLCRDWPVQAAGVAPSEPAAVVVANRVVVTTPGARRLGVQVGQRRREAQSRSPDLVVLERDEGRDARAFEAVLAAVEAFTPRLELTRPGACAFAARGPSRYFGGDEALAGRLATAVDAVLAPTGWAGAVGVGIADGPFAAALAARRASPAGTWVVPPGESPAFLAPLPVGALDRPELAEVLGRLGIHTLGDLAALDAADVLARFGTDGQTAHRLAAGLDERPPALADPPPDLAVERELDPPAERVDVVAFAGKALADDLLAALAARGLSCTRVLIGAETEHGESVERCWRHEGALSAGAIADRVRWQLEGWLNGSAAVRPTSGVSLLRLVPDEVVPARGRQLGFWGGETAAADRAGRALARIAGLLGPDAVAVPEWRGGRGPEERITLVPATAVDLEGERPATDPAWVRAPWPGRVPPPSPAVVHIEPRPAEVVDVDDRPVVVTGRGLVSAPPAMVAVDGGPARPVVAWAGPWPADERWWDPDTHRRRARFQLVVAEPGPDAGVDAPRAGTRSAAPSVEVAHLAAVEGGRWWIEATYD